MSNIAYYPFIYVKVLFNLFSFFTAKLIKLARSVSDIYFSKTLNMSFSFNGITSYRFSALCEIIQACSRRVIETAKKSFPKQKIEENFHGYFLGNVSYKTT